MLEAANELKVPICAFSPTIEHQPITDPQRKVLSDAALWLEGLDAENTAVIAAERDRQTKAGIQPIDFGADESSGKSQCSYCSEPLKMKALLFTSVPLAAKSLRLPPFRNSGFTC